MGQDNEKPNSADDWRLNSTIFDDQGNTFYASIQPGGKGNPPIFGTPDMEIIELQLRCAGQESITLTREAANALYDAINEAALIGAQLPKSQANTSLSTEIATPDGFVIDERSFQIAPEDNPLNNH